MNDATGSSDMLIEAAGADELQVIQILVEQTKISIEYQNDKGETALDLSSDEVGSWLLKNDAQFKKENLFEAVEKKNL